MSRAPLAVVAGVAVALGVARAEPAPPAPERPAPPPVFEDGIPPPPSLGERVERIRRRVRLAVVYPELARRRGIEGRTTIRFLVRPDGRADAIETVESSGSRLLDRAAEDGARDAGELPYVYGRVEVPVRFSLE